jgi:hypothetical protein
MKLDISIPNPVHKAAERLAKKSGVSLSELYTAALIDYVMSHGKDQLTDALNQVYKTESSEIEPEFVKIQMASVDGDDW